MAISSTAMLRSIRARMFQMQSEQDDSWVGLISPSTPFFTDQPSETYVGLSSAPALRKWIGARSAKGLDDRSIEVVNDKFESTLYVTVDELERDKTGQIRARIDDLMRRARQHWAKLAVDTLVANPLCYDGQNLFDTDHTEGANTTNQSNALSGAAATGTDPTPEEFEAALFDSIEAMMGFKDDENEPYHGSVTRYLVLVPPFMYRAALGALKAPLLSGGASNITVSASGLSFDLRAEPRLAGQWTDKFVVAAADGRTLIRQEERAPRTSAKAEGSDFAHDNDAHEYGISVKRGMGPGNWQSAVRYTFT